MIDDPDIDDRRVVALVVASIAVIGAFGAVLGYVLPAVAGLEELVVLEMVVPVTPTGFALYGGVTAGVFAVTFLLVVRAIARFDEKAV